MLITAMSGWVVCRGRSRQLITMSGGAALRQRVPQRSTVHPWPIMIAGIPEATDGDIHDIAAVKSF